MRAATLFAASLALSSVGAQAAPSSSLQELFSGETLTWGRFVVSNWSLDQNQSDVPIDFSAIPVQIVGSFEGFTIDYDFGNQLAVTDSDSIYLDFSYSVTDLSRPHFVSNLLELTDPFFGADSGSIIVDEDVFCGPPSRGWLAGRKHTDIEPGYGINVRSDSASFLCKDELWIEKRIAIISEGALVQLGDMHQVFVPAPATVALLGLGLFAIRRTRAPAVSRATKSNVE